MAFLTPLFLLLGLLAAPIILMYMLRLRRREVTISSAMLWQKLLRDREANAPWQKLRRNLLLLLQLLILSFKPLLHGTYCQMRFNARQYFFGGKGFSDIVNTPNLKPINLISRFF